MLNNRVYYNGKMYTKTRCIRLQRLHSFGVCTGRHFLYTVLDFMKLLLLNASASTFTVM